MKSPIRVAGTGSLWTRPSIDGPPLGYRFSQSRYTCDRTNA